MVINGLDECDDSILPFLEKLCYQASTTEYNFKIVLASSTKQSIQTALSAWPTINLDDHAPVTDVEGLKAEVERELLSLVQQYPALYNSETEMTDKLFKCGDDQEWRQIISREIRDTRGSKNELESLEITSSQKSLDRILSSISSPLQVWSRKVLSLVLYSYHPLSVWELAQAVSPRADPLPDTDLPSNRLYEEFVVSLETCFKGSLIVQHGLVFFGHPEARQFFASLDSRPDAEKAAHEDIVNICQEHISSKEGQECLQALFTNAAYDVEELPIFPHRYTFLTYAVKYWPKHYHAMTKPSHGAESSPIPKNYEQWIFDSKTMRNWAEAYWSLSNSVHRSDRGFLSFLPVFAGLGLRDITSAFLVRGAGKPAFEKDCALALAEAVRYGQGTIVHMLLDTECFTETDMLDALFAANASLDESMLEELVTYTRKKFPRFNWPATTVLRACQFGHDTVLRKLLEFGASPNEGIELNGMTPLFAAAREGKPEVIKVLLEYKAGLEAKAQHGRHPLHAACVFGHAEAAKLLIAAGADVNGLDSENETPITLAVQWGNHKVLEVMAKEACILDGTCGELTIRTPLTIVADLGFIKCARVLLDNKATTEVVCGSDWPPLRYAITRENMELIKLLLDAGADPNTSHGGEPLITTEAIEGKLDVIKLLVEHGAKVDAVNSQGATAMHCAAEKGFTEMITYLLDHGAALNSQLTAGHTGVLLAASCGHPDAVKLLIDRGADISIPTTDGWTAIGLSYDNAEVTRLLMEAGANADRTNNTYTPLYLAAMYGYTEVGTLVYVALFLTILILCSTFVHSTCTHSPTSKLVLVGELCANFMSSQSTPSVPNQSRN